MRMLLAGGGTGGHLFPAVALAQNLLTRNPDASVLFVGTERGLEQRLLPQLGFALETVDMVGVVGRGWKGRFQLLPKLVKSLGQARFILKQFQPDIVVGVGGYASVPVLLAAKLARIPYVIHEQNALGGLSNRMLGKGAKKIFLSFPESAKGFPQSRSVVTGNPLRTGLEQVSPELPVAGKILVFGGSRGARAINQAVIAMLPLLKEWPERPELIHQTGQEDYAEVKQAYADAGLDPAQVLPFIDDMASAYDQASLVVCRAGATTLAELAVTGRPAILIPFPFAAADHQTANALAFARAGAAEVLMQKELSAETLAMKVQILFSDRQRLTMMAACGRAIGRPGAAEKILAECRQLIGQK